MEGSGRSCGPAAWHDEFGVKARQHGRAGLWVRAPAPRSGVWKDSTLLSGISYGGTQDPRGGACEWEGSG